MKILFLYTELADYSMACLDTLSRQETELLIIHFPVNQEAPFSFEFEHIGRFISCDKFADYSSFISAIRDFKPERIVCSGWTNKWYLRAVTEFKRKSLCILALDNHWKGNVKQQILALVSKFTIADIFAKIWIPGEPQMIYAKKLGFSEKDILKGFYCCDLKKFVDLHKEFEKSKQKRFPHRLLCVARYIPKKGYNILWDAFVDWKKRCPNDWQLWCVGTGALFPERVEHIDIKHFGFIQGSDWKNIVEHTGVFILPSQFEPWGVVVQEFGAAGYPLILSKHVGSSGLFLKESNGFKFDPANKEELIDRFVRIADMSDTELYLMGNISNQYARQFTPERWASNLLNA